MSSFFIIIESNWESVSINNKPEDVTKQTEREMAPTLRD